MIFNVGNNSAGQCGTGAFKQWLIAMACYYPFRLPQSHLHYEKVINQQIFNGSRPKHNGFHQVYGWGQAYVSTRRFEQKQTK